MSSTAQRFEILNLNSQFKRIYSKGKSCVRPTLVVYSRQNSLGFNRLGITVSKKIGKAVIRNRAKRRLREVFRNELFLLKNGYDFILVARGKTAYANFSTLTHDFLSAAKELEVLKND